LRISEGATHTPRAAKESLRRERRSPRHDIAGRRHFGAARRKKHARANGLEKIGSAIWFALDTRKSSGALGDHLALLQDAGREQRSGGAAAVLKAYGGRQPRRRIAVERREAQRARSRRFPQGDVLWRAPRPERERVATSVRVARPRPWRLPALHFRAWFCWLGLAWHTVAWTMIRCLDETRMPCIARP
jgi:hypothetical protein